MNKKAQVGVWGYTLMIGLTIIILALALAPAGKKFIDDARNVTVGDTLGLDCDNASISNFDKGTCIIVDVSLFYFFGGLILIGGGILLARVIA